jgi:CubicO group peptidase (beta-lactamase class C family)
MLAALLCGGAKATTAAAAAPPSPLGAFLDGHWPRGASGTVLVARDGHPLLCRGLGWADRARHVRAGCDTAYDVMSMTKQFTATAILKLAQMGRLRVSDPISRFVAEVPPDKASITIDQLLTHTSGLLDSLGGDYEPLTRAGLVSSELALTEVPRAIRRAAAQQPELPLDAFVTYDERQAAAA